MNYEAVQIMRQMLMTGQNPMAYVRSMAQRDPRAAQFLQMIDGKSPQQLQQMAENMARERGISLNDVIRQLGIALPSER